MILILLFLCLPLLAQEIEVIPEEKDIADEIHEIATLEMSIGERLRDDKTDRTLQEDIEESIERMEKLIKDADAVKETDKETKRKNDLLVLKGKRAPNKNPSNRSEDLKQKSEEYGRENNDWASLPRSDRDEIVQTWAKDIPTRWRKRIEAYFLSVNADDTVKKEKKDRKK